MVRRILSVLLCICLTLSSLPLTVFGTEATGGHEHSYSSAVTEEATCTREGVTTYTCTCGDSFAQRNPMTAHSWEAGVCLVCGAAEEASEPEAAPAEDFGHGQNLCRDGGRPSGRVLRTRALRSIAIRLV